MTQNENQAWLRYLVLFLVMALLATLACQTLLGEPEDELIEATEVVDVLPAATEVVPEITEEEEQSGPDVEETPVESSTEETPTPESDDGLQDEQEDGTTQDESEDQPLSDAGPLTLGQYGFIQKPDDYEVAYAFHVENPDSVFGIEDSEYQVAIFDDSGTVIETDSGFISLILPSENTAIAGSIYLDEGVRAADMEIQIKPGEPVQMDSFPSLETHTPRYFGDEFSERGTGILESHYDEYMEDIIVSFVTYDESGNISGSGYTYVDWVDAQSSIGVDAYLATNGDVDQIVMYPRTSFFSLEPAYGILPDDASALVLVSSGYVKSEDGFTYGLEIANDNENYAVENSKYVVSAYTSDGSILFSETGYLDLLPPSGTVVGGGFEFLETDEEIDFLDFQVRAGEFIESGPIPELTAENVAYLPDDFVPTVTGEITNPFDWDLEIIRVWAVLYDEAGEFIGGGYDYISFIPANGSAAVEVYVDGLADPASVELIAALEYYDESIPPQE